MIRSPAHIVQWLRAAAAKRDRVLVNALNTGQAEVREEPPGWRVRAVSRRGVEYNVVVVMNPVGYPVRYYRGETPNMGNEPDPPQPGTDVPL